jgi:hypothetical protein
MNFSFQGCHPHVELEAMVIDINTDFMNNQWLIDSSVNAYVTKNVTKNVENLDSKRPFDSNELLVWAIM